VVIANDTALVTTAHVDPTVWADEDYEFELTITDDGGTDSVTITKTVLRSAWVSNKGSNVDRPCRVTMTS
jgi:PKD repeat protein